MNSSRRFDHEKLEVYQLQLQFIAWLAELCEEARQLNRVGVFEEE